MRKWTALLKYYETANNGTPEMIVFLRDWSLRTAESIDHPTTWRKSLGMVVSLSHEGAVDSDLLPEDLEAPSPSSLLSKDTVIFLHPGGELKTWTDWFSNTTNSPKGHLVIVGSRGEIIPHPEWPDRVHACYWPPEDFSPNTNNGAVRQFIADLNEGVFRPELLQPCAVPESVLAYCLAVHYCLDIHDVSALRDGADREYAEILSFAKTVAGRNTDQVKEYEKNLLPGVDEFERNPKIGDEATSVRFRAMRSLIDLLRSDH